MCHKIFSSFDFYPQPYKTVETPLSWWAIQKLVSCWIWLTDCGSPTSGLYLCSKSQGVFSANSQNDGWVQALALFFTPRVRHGAPFHRSGPRFQGWVGDGDVRCHGGVSGQWARGAPFSFEEDSESQLGTNAIGSY